MEIIYSVIDSFWSLNRTNLGLKQMPKRIVSSKKFPFESN